MTAPTHDADAQRDQALRHHQAGRLAEAEAIYRHLITRDAADPQTLHLLGALCSQTNRIAEAIQQIEQALAIQPTFPEARYNLAHAFVAAGRRSEAIDTLREAIAQRPDFAEAHNNLGGLLRDAGQTEQAIVAFRAALACRANYPEALVNLGTLLRWTHADEALAHAQKAAALQPTNIEARHLLAMLSSDHGSYDAALTACREALAVAPNHPALLSLLASVLKEVGRIDEAIAAGRQAIALRPGDRVAHDNLLLALHYHPAQTPASLLAEHRAWANRHSASITRHTGHANDRDPARRLRVGYLSPDFRRHPVGRFLEPLLAHHDRSHVEVFCYDHSPRADDVTERLRSHTDGWRSIAALEDDAAAERIREDRIDVLVDLTMHAARNRLLLLARRPAPVQATWLAYNSTTGLDAIDYRLSDPHFDPPGTEGDYVERTIRLPRTYWCYPAPPEADDVTPPPSITNGVVTFGCLNAFAKTSDVSLATWANVLKAVPQSRLILHAPAGSARRRVLATLDRACITGERVTFVARLTTADYFRRYGEIDIALDPFPYAGGTTTCDALWMGVPVVTLRGGTSVGRAGVSVLTNVGLMDCVATSVEEYVRIAAGLASDGDRLRSLRATMRNRLLASPLMDAKQFARDVEAAYRAMWIAWSGGYSPAD